MKDLYVVAAIGLAAPLNPAVFRAGIESQLARHPYFSSIQVTDKHGGTPRWTRTAVNVDDHIVVVSNLAGAEEDDDPDKAVEEYLSSLSTLPIYAPPTYAPPTSASLVWSVWYYLVVAWHTVVDVAAFVATIFFLRDPHTLFKRADHGEPHHRRRMRFVHRSLSLDDVKFVRNAMHCMDVDKIKSGKSNAVRWGNRLGYIILPFHLALHNDPLEYVRKAKQIIDRKKSSLETIVLHMAVETIFKIFGPKVELCGHPVAYIAPSVYGLQQLLDDFAEFLNLTKEAAAKTPTKSIKDE
ncbi:hypothetical protein HU200_014170 [Digitaria exilis]|uniref:O-acyltransferase WSD1 C-terminal domain-containing protein n=1 Tax=Digitaria exilis TaxID=1010633 RepID=A0A835FBK1_9POAL|nr:hypothetical protein HU200_014170 [Digitaria exilis]